MADRFTARGRAGRARSRRLAWWAGGVVVLVAAVVYLIAFSPLLVVEDVVVTGADDDVASMARQHAAIPPMRPLARVDTAAAADRVAADTRVKTVEVRRDWPSVITIALTLREPEAILTQPGRPVALVDGSGVAYEAVATGPEGLLRITAPRGPIDQESLAGALRARSALEPSWRRQVSQMQITTDGDLRFSIGSAAVLWGRPEAEEAKGAALRALLAQEGIDPDDDGAPVTIDVTAPQTPVVSGLPPAPTPDE
ncbi:MAG: FtsQ-type POTRA domain-containing protein [Ornithinimicrobium sp.]